MSQQKRKQKRAEQQRILSELDAAVQEERAHADKAQDVTTGSAQTEQNAAGQYRRNFYDSAVPEQLHCRRCRTLMKNGVCPTCGFKMYVPISEEKRKKIRGISTIVALIAFLIIFVVIQASKG